MTTTWPEPFGQCEHMRLVNETETSNPLTASLDILRGFQMIFACYKQINANAVHQPSFFSSPTTIINHMAYFSAISFSHVVTVFLFTALWTIARTVFVSKVFTPLAHHLQVMPKNVQKFSESAWKTLACSFMWSSACYVTFFRGYDFFSNPLHQFSDWTLHHSPFDLNVVYAIEASFYFHSIYATLFMDEWRRDSIAMLCHHLVALNLIIFSFAISSIKIGVLIFLLDDINDVLLELGKCATYLRNRASGFSKFWDVVSNAMAVMFAVCWVVMRLYFHLTKVWRSGSLGIWVSHPVLPLPFHFFQNAFLGSLYAFYVYWFWFIVLFIGRILFTKNSGDVEDPRESVEKTQPSKKHAHTNGYSKKNM